MQENDESLSFRKLVFKENADSVTYALKKDVSFFTSSNRTNFLNEDFNSNLNSWPIYNQFTNATYPESYAKIENGKYKICGGVSQPLLFSISKLIDTSKNFEITVKLKNGDMQGGNTIFPQQVFFWNSLIINNSIIGIGMGITGHSINRGFGLYNYYSGGNNSKLYQFDVTNDFYDIITFRKIKNKCSYFFNGQFVEIRNIADFTMNGNRIGFEIYDQAEIEYIQIDYLTF